MVVIVVDGGGGGGGGGGGDGGDGGSGGSDGDHDGNDDVYGVWLGFRIRFRVAVRSQGC